MILRILRKELLSHLLTLRFVLGGLCCLALIISSSCVLTSQYESRLEAHRSAVTDHESRLQKVKVYSELGASVLPEAHRPPTTLSILSAGMESRLGDYVTLAHGYVPVAVESSGSDNPYLAIFPTIDFVTVFQVVLSLLALLFAYDAIAGEREGGTLKLVLSGAVPRSAVLLGKWLGAVLSLAIPLFLSLGLGLLIASSSEYVDLGGQDIARLGFILVVSLLYLSLFYLAGLVSSCAADRSSTALGLCLFIWAVAVLIYPGAAIFALDRLSPVKSDRSVTEAVGELTLKMRDDTLDYLRQRGLEGEGPHPTGWVWKGISRSMGIQGDSNDYGSGETVITTVRSAKDPELVLQRDFYRYQENLRVETADRIWQLHKDYAEKNPLRQARIARRLARLSPAAVYDQVSATLAGTGLGAHRRFMKQTRAYRQEVIQFFRNRDAFGSRTWFTSDRGEADVASLPRFGWRAESLPEALERASVDLAILIAWNAILLWIAYVMFVRRRAV